MGNDDRLKALFAYDEPPARDPAFSSAVMEKLMRRRFLADVAMLSGVSALGGTALWALWPSLQPAVVAISQGLAPAIVAGALALGAAVVFSGRRPAALLGFET
jgi:hypothetical protein